MERYNGFEELLLGQEEKRPEKTALIFEAHGRPGKMTYKELSEAVRRRTQKLQSMGKTCMGIVCDGSRDCIVNIFAGVLSGMQVVLLGENTPDQVLARQIRVTDVDLLWGDEELAEDFEDELTQGVSSPEKGDIIIFTSGTTGSSKAVVLTDRSLMSSAYNGSLMLPLAEEEILQCMLPLDHVFGLVCSVLWGLNCGCSVALGRGARHFTDDLMLFRPTVLSAVPSLLAFLLKHDALNPELRMVLIGAGDCPADLAGALASKKIRTVFGYGLTETSSGVALSVSGDPAAMDICPEVHITTAPDGEILIEAPTCMMKGYYRLRRETEAVLKDGVLYSGDLGEIDEDGRLRLTGRKKEILVLPGGTKIFLPEYEERLSDVTGISSLAVGLKDGRPVLVVCESPSRREIILEEIRDVMTSYPREQQIRDIVFVKDPLPRTATGKLVRSAVDELIKKNNPPKGE